MSRVDVLIVGGGIAGASLAARLAGSLRVMLIEAETLCGRHATGRSVAFWQASLGAGTPERTLTLRSKPMFDDNWPGSETPLLRPRGTLHLVGTSGETIEDVETHGPFAVHYLDRAALDAKLPGLAPHWTGAWWEPSCADIDVAAFHGACLAATRRQGGEVRTDCTLLSARPLGDGWQVRTNRGLVEAGLIVNAAGAWSDAVARACGIAPIGLVPKRRTVVQLRIGRDRSRDLPMVTDLHQSFYFKGEGERSVWVCPLDESPVDPCDAAPDELDVATAVDRFERATTWPVEAVERKWAGLRTFAPDRRMRFGFDAIHQRFFWCVGQGGMGIQTAPAASLLCATLVRGGAMPADLVGIDPLDFAV